MPDPLRPVLRRVGRAAVEIAAQTCSLVVPRRCPCGRDGTWLCDPCRGLLAAAPQRVDSCCDALQLLHRARVLEEDPAHPAGVEHASLLPVLALGEHAGALQHLTLAWKNGGMAHLTGPIAAGMLASVEQLSARAGPLRSPPDDPAAPPCLVAVPSRRAARVRRGEDHIHALVREMARRGAGEALRLAAAPSTAQTGATARERRTRRIRLSRSARARVGGRRVVIIDDVVTTGATLRGMHEALTGAGAEVLGAAVIGSARLPRSVAVPGRAQRGLAERHDAQDPRRPA